MTSTMLSQDQYRALQQPKIEPPTPDELFESNVETLVSVGLAKYEQADAFRNDLPEGLFLWIPPRPAEITQDWLNKLMSKIEHEERSGRNYLDAAYLKNEIRVQADDRGYLMTDIEDGYGRRNVRCSTSLESIKTKHRSPYTAIEGVFHALVYPQIFESHYMDLLGSRYENLWVFLDVSGGLPRLIYRDDYANPVYGAPSCRERIVL